MDRAISPGITATHVNDFLKEAEQVQKDGDHVHARFDRKVPHVVLDPVVHKVIIPGQRPGTGCHLPPFPFIAYQFLMMPFIEKTADFTSAAPGVPVGIRTQGLSLRRRTLYPAELREQGCFYSGRNILAQAVRLCKNRVAVLFPTPIPATAQPD